MSLISLKRRQRERLANTISLMFIGSGLLLIGYQIITHHQVTVQFVKR